MKGKWGMWIALMLVAGCMLIPGVAGAETIQGQKQMLIVDDMFQFVPGTWGDYTIVDKVKKESYHMVFSVLNDEKVQGKDCSWMQIKIDMKGKPTVVTKILMEKTPKGPGKAMRAIVQVAGFDPFIVPEKYLKGGKDQVAPSEKYEIVRKLRKKKVIYKGREVSLWQVQTATKEGKKATVWVAENVPPLGVFKVDLPGYGMVLNDWGTGARNEITGTPMNFYVWIAKVIASAFSKGMAESKK